MVKPTTTPLADLIRQAEIQPLIDAGYCQMSAIHGGIVRWFNQAGEILTEAEAFRRVKDAGVPQKERAEIQEPEGGG